MTRDITIVGFGNQGRAWAPNLRDSGWNVTVAVRDPVSLSAAEARRSGFNVVPLERALPVSKLIAVLIPDDAIPVFSRTFGSLLAAGQTLVFAHGYALHFRTAVWPDTLDRILVAPKGIGTAVRSRFQEGSGVPAVLAVDQNASGDAWPTAHAIAEGLGAGKAGVYEATVREEVESDLFSEQAILCGGMLALIHEAYDMLVKSNIRPEVAYLECVHELAFMTDLIQRRGIHETLQLASPTARFGGIQAGRRLLSPEIKETLRRLLVEIQSGEFHERLQRESAGGFPETEKDMGDLRASLMENTGRAVRARIRGTS